MTDSVLREIGYLDTTRVGRLILSRQESSALLQNPARVRTWSEGRCNATGNLSLWVAAQALQQSALGDSFRSVESKQPRRGRTGAGNRFNHRALELEMVGPPVRPRVKEAHDLSRVPVYPSNITSLVPVADQAGVRQVV